MESGWAVSYTHLDVYKRQECVQNLLLLLGKVVEHKVTEVAVDFVEPVSYTHLKGGAK